MLSIFVGTKYVTRLAREAARSEEMLLSNSRRVRDVGPDPSPGRIPVALQVRHELLSLESLPRGKALVLLILAFPSFCIHDGRVRWGCG